MLCAGSWDFDKAQWNLGWRVLDEPLNQSKALGVGSAC